jgi:hypothetical protein
MATFQVSSRASAQPILHEFVRPIHTGHDDDGRWARAGRLPDFIRNDNDLLPKPTVAQPDDRSAASAVAHSPDSSRRRLEARLDRTTTHDGQLHYQATFNPSVVPFKRMEAFDRITRDFRMIVGNPELEAVELARRVPPPGHDAFWGSVELTFNSSAAVPLPSVAPEARIVAYETTPRTTLSFYRDSADNFWVRSPHRRRVQLVFLSDAPQSYFAPELPAFVSTKDIPRRLRPVVPKEVAAAARQVIAHIGLDPRQTMRRTLDRMVAYFRSFREGPLDRRSRNAYLDIALSQRGVCRHRSFAFVVTAQALGIPARYVQNEAHVFVEVYLPQLGWVRIDLGGAASRLSVANAANKAVYAGGRDPFPRPNRFTTAYSQLQGNIRGLRPEQRRRRLQATERSLLPTGTSPTGTAAPTAPGSGDPAPGETQQGPGVDVRVNGPKTNATADHPQGAMRDSNEAAAEQKVPVRLVLRASQAVVYRGEAIEISGAVTTMAGGLGVSSLPVQLMLSLDGRHIDAELQGTQTNAQGRFSVRRPAPVDLPVGVYRLFAATPGNARFRGASTVTTSPSP